jgi:hypothetical protein
MNNNELKKHKKGVLKGAPKCYSLKVSEKGCMSLCGLRRFPVSLYKSEWEVIIGLVKNGSIESFLDKYADELKVKDDTKDEKE